MIEDVITVNLADFGIDGVAEISKPTFRRTRMMKNEIGKCMNARIDEKGNPHFDQAELGDMEILRVLSFIKSAPFPTDFKGFLAHCDRMDDACPGSADKMYSELQKAIVALERAPGPLEHSASAETVS
jgi:hypothetical protein